MAVEMRPMVLFNPDSRSPNFFLPGLTAVLLLNVTTFLTAFSIVREKERGTLEQLFVTPVRPLGLLLGKLLPYLFIGFAELCAIVTCMPARLAIKTAELGTAVGRAMGWLHHVKVKRLPAVSLSFSCMVSRSASAWQGWYMLDSMLITGTVE